MTTTQTFTVLSDNTLYSTDPEKQQGAMSPRNQIKWGLVLTGLALFVLAFSLVSSAVTSAVDIERQMIPVGVVQAKRIAITDFSHGVLGCGQKGSLKYNNGLFVGVDGKFGNDFICGRQVKVIAPNGIQAIGVVIDIRAANESLDLSPVLFERFYPLEKGIFDGGYQFLDKPLPGIESLDLDGESSL